MKQILLLAIVWCTVTGVHAQLFDPSAAQAELVATLLGTGRVFTATVTVSREKGGKQVTIADNVMSMCDGNICIEHNPANEPAFAKLTAKLKKNNLAAVVTILLPKANTADLLFPGKHAYLESPAEKGAPPRIASTFLRAETVAGHLCTVRRITATSADDSEQQLIVWEATDLQGFIIKSQMDRGDDTNEILRFTDIRTEKPASEKFVVPSGYKKLTGEAAGEIAKLMTEVDIEQDSIIAETLR